MGKTRNGARELARVKELSYENKQLKAENDMLRKRLARIKLDEYGQLKKTIKKHYKKEEAKQGNDILDKVRQEWKCHDCPKGFLEIFIYNRANETYYYRTCNECDNRTKAQKYDPQIVKGIIKKAATNE